jgi:HSP20 family protein
MTVKPFPIGGKEDSASSQASGDGNMADLSTACEHIMNRFTNDFFTNFDFLPLTVFEDQGSLVPRAHIFDDPEKIVVTAELPGVDAGDIDIFIKSDLLIISGQGKRTARGTNPASRIYGHGPAIFRKMIPIPCLIDMQKVQATFTNGILQIRIPKVMRDNLTRFRIPIEKG